MDVGTMLIYCGMLQPAHLIGSTFQATCHKRHAPTYPFYEVMSQAMRRCLLYLPFETYPLTVVLCQWRC